LTRLRAAMKDPTSRQIILQEMQNAQGDPLGNALSKLGTAMSTARTPGGSAAAGLGGVLGLGLGMLLKKRRGAQSAGGGGSTADTTSGSYTPSTSSAEPNLAQPAGTTKTGAGADIGPTASPTEKTLTPPVTAATSTSPTTGTAGTLMMASDDYGRPIHSFNGGQTWLSDRGGVYKGQVYSPSEIGTVGGSTGNLSSAASSAGPSIQALWGLPQTRMLTPSVTPPATIAPASVAPTGSAPTSVSPASITPRSVSPAAGTAGNYMMATDDYGRPIHSFNGGKTWLTDAGSAYTGQAYSPSEIGTVGGMRRGGRIRQFAGGGHAADDALPLPSKPPEGRGILRRAPIPVISTTIVIAHHKPKPTGKKAPPKKPVKKKTGGPVQPPLKPAALPPKKGPGDGGPPAPYRKGGHVQVPRGSGIAQRGKAFRGIF
jgi:hypothetical protein